MHKLIVETRKQLHRLGRGPVQISGTRFFKPGVKGLSLEISTQKLRSVANEYFKRYPLLSKPDAMVAVDEFLRSGINDEAVIACSWLKKFQKFLEPKDLEAFEGWLEDRILNWATCDTLCITILGEFFFRYPKLLPRLNFWTKSKGVWVRRASAVSLIYSLRRGANISLALTIATALLKDSEDLVQKGFGWMLKEGSKRFSKEIVDFMTAKRTQMGRTAFRYAIEKLPLSQRKKLMKK